jgi:hypothetical protein
MNLATLTPAQRDALAYSGGAVAGALLAKSLGAKLLGVAIGGTGGIALAAWWLLKPKQTA